MSALVCILFGALFPLAASYSLGRLMLRKLPLPRSIALATGAAVFSYVVFVLLLAGLANRWTFALIGVAALLPAFAIREVREPLPGRDRERAVFWLLSVILGGYGLLYLVHALAPEIQPDGYTYHLGLVREWLRAGGFTGRVTFFEMVPHGLEMLFTVAFAYGRHSAAKLVHFAFLVMTVPLLFSVGRRLGLANWVPAAAAGLYVCSPVVGISGTSSYNDAALVFFVLAAFYLLCAWEQDRDDRYLIPAGLAAGFCYAIKFTGLLVAPLAVLYVASRQRWKAPLLTACGAVLMTAPWMVRNAVLTGNPLAPLFNRFFPNPYFHISTEQGLAQFLGGHPGVSIAALPLDLTIRGYKLSGLIGPVFLLAPIALLSLRQRAGRIVTGVALLMAVPWFFNLGARFLMPSLVFIALAMAMAVPRPLALGCLVLQAVACWPWAMDQYAYAGAWRLQGLPWRAALRLEPEEEYLRGTLREYRMAELMRKHTGPGDRVLALIAAPKAYTSADVTIPWQSAKGDLLGDVLKIAAVPDNRLLRELPASWPEQPLTALRFRQTASAASQWSIQEVRLYDGDRQIPASRGWRLAAWPNVWETPLAFDRNLVSGWATWEPVRPGMYLDVEFDRPLPLTGAQLFSLRSEEGARVDFYGRSADGAWQLLSRSPVPSVRPALNLRSSAIRFLRRHGIRYILAPVGNEGYGTVGRALVAQSADWGVEVLGNAGNVYLARISASE